MTAPALPQDTGEKATVCLDAASRLGRTAMRWAGREVVNGAPISGPYLHGGSVTSPPPEIAAPAGCRADGRSMGCDVPLGHVFLLGDNRRSSHDSRSFGPVPLSDISGVARAILWPLGHLRSL